MKLSFPALLFCLGIGLEPGRAIAQQPIVVLTIKSFDEILGDVKAIAARTGSPRGGNVDAFLGQAGFGKGIPGLDPGKPIGLCLDWPGSGQFRAVVLAPVKDARAFAALLGLSEAQAGGVEGRTFAIQPFGQTVYARIAGGYCALATDRDGAERPPSPSCLESGPFDIRIQSQLGQIAASKRRELVQSMLTALAAADGRLLDAVDARSTSSAYRSGAELASRWRREELLRIIEDGDRLSLGVRCDGKAGTLGIEWEVQARAGTGLAGEYNKIAAAVPAFGGLWSSDAAVSAVFSVPVPGGIRDAILENFGRGQSLVQAEVDRSRYFTNVESRTNAHDSLEDVARAFDGLKELNGAFLLNGGPGQKPLVIAAVNVAQGAELQKAFGRWGKFPPAVFAPGELKVNAETHAGIGLHKLGVPDMVGEPFGGTAAYFAVRGNALFFTLGQGSLGAIKMALDRTRSSGARRQPLTLRITPSKVLSLISSELDLRGKRLEHSFRGPGDLFTYDMAAVPNGLKGQLAFGEGFLRAIIESSRSK